LLSGVLKTDEKSLLNGTFQKTRLIDMSI